MDGGGVGGGVMVRVVMCEMGSGLLPNRPQTGTGPRPGAWGALVERVSNFFHKTDTHPVPHPCWGPHPPTP